LDYFQNCRDFSCVLVAISGVFAGAIAQADMALSATDHQLRRLMHPTPAELASEEKGGVFIYDSLEINQIHAALDENFERMQHMMFTRINHLSPSGAGPAVVEDDGCD
jgi:hypothetical protein